MTKNLQIWHCIFFSAFTAQDQYHNFVDLIVMDTGIPIMSIFYIYLISIIKDLIGKKCDCIAVYYAWQGLTGFCTWP